VPDWGKEPRVVTDVNLRADRADSRAALTALRLPELQALAADLGIGGASRLRKGELVDAIDQIRNTEDASTEQDSSAREVVNQAAVEAPVRKRTSRRVTSADTEVIAAASSRPGAPAADVSKAEDPTQPDVRPDTVEPDAARQDAAGPDTAQPDAAGPDTAQPDFVYRDKAPDSEPQPDATPDEDATESSGTRSSRNRNRNRNGSDAQQRRQAAASGDQARGDQDRGDQEARPAQQQNQRTDNQQQAQRTDAQRTQDGELDTDRSGRSRYRDRKRGRGPVGDDFETEISDDDVLIPVAGILDVLDNYAFVRTSGYLPGNNDVYVSLGQVKRYNLRKGDAVVGAIRQPRDGDNAQGRQKYNAIVRVDSINGLALEAAATRVEFANLTPLYPTERLRLETEPGKLSTRIIDLVSPIGKGQRGLIVSPPKAGKTLILQAIANAISKNNPEVHLMVVLVDERPEEVTDMQRTVKGEVIASTFDRPAEDHTTVAELAIERAKRLVELGHDVVVLLDSITRLGRAYHLAAPASGRVLSGGVDSAAFYPLKRFFGAARNVEEGGSLTIIATALVETGSNMDEVIFEEFTGTGNMELRLSRQLADKRIFPAVDVNASGTRREEVLMGADETRVTGQLRRALAGVDHQQALETVLGRLRETQTNVEFLMQVQKSMPAVAAPDRG